MGISLMYNFRADPDLGIVKIVNRRISYAYDGYMDQLNSVCKEGTIDEDQPRYKTSRKCELNNIFECLNEWRVTTLITSKNDEVHDDKLAKNILYGIESRMLEKIVKGNYGAMRTDALATDGYYILNWSSIFYTCQEDIVMKGYNPLEYAYAGEMVCQERFWNPVGKANYWYTPMSKGE